jgi:hypothetical protein
MASDMCSFTYNVQVERRAKALDQGHGLLEYPAGSWGPSAASALFQGCEGGWSQG